MQCERSLFNMLTGHNIVFNYRSRSENQADATKFGQDYILHTLRFSGDILCTTRTHSSQSKKLLFRSFRTTESGKTNSTTISSVEAAMALALHNIMGWLLLRRLKNDCSQDRPGD